MVSGYMWKDNLGKSFRDIIKKRSFRLLLPYFIWGMISICVFQCGQKFSSLLVDGSDWYYKVKLCQIPSFRVNLISLVHAGAWPNGEGFIFNSVLWFLPCLFIVLLIYDILCRIKCSGRAILLNSKFYIGVLVLIFILLGGIMRFYAPKFLPWGLNRVPYMMIFFLLGRMLKILRMKSYQSGLMPIIVFSAWLLFGLVAWFYPDLAIGYLSWRWYLYTIFLAVYGGVITFYTAQMIDCYFLSLFGLCSMGIMLQHKFLILPLQLAYGKLNGNNPIVILIVALLISCVVCVLSLCFTVIIRRNLPLALGEGGNGK